jgi:hypothetical protein
MVPRLLALLMLAGPAVCLPQGVPPDQSRVTALYDSLADPALDPEHGYNLLEVTLTRGGQLVTFHNGTLHAFTAVNGHRFGAVFTGKGEFTIHPLTDIERREFERQTSLLLVDGKHAYPFQRAVLWFSDSSFTELTSTSDPKPMKVLPEEDRAVRRSLQYATDRSNENVLHRILQEMFEQAPEPYFLGHFIQDQEGNDLFLEVDPRRFEEVVVEQPYLGSTTGFNFWRTTLSAFHLPQEYASNTEFELNQEDKRRVETLSSTTSMEYDGARTIKVDALLHLRSLVTPPPAALKLRLFPLLKIRSISTETGMPVSYHRDDKSWEIEVLLPRQDSADFRLRFVFEGEFIWPLNRSLVLDNAISWYPRLFDFNRQHFDMTFRFPDHLRLAGTGTLELDTVIQGTRTVRYVTRKPTMIASFGIGDFKEYPTRLTASETPVVVYDLPGSKAVDVGKDVANSIRLFTSLLGEFPYDTLRVTSSPGLNGQAFEGLIHLPWLELNIASTHDPVYLDRAHEVAHAYWGHTVGWQSYHDQWLSEGLAHYYGLLYAPFILHEEGPFLERLRAWREQIVEARQYAFGSGPAVGSIWMGYRASSSKTPNDHLLLAYKKGAWIIHMLRMMMLDLTSFKEDAFKAMMADFYQSFKDRDPSSTDFMHVVEKYFRVKMDWFFDQWIYRSAIPTYRWKYQSRQIPDSGWAVTISATQTGVPDTFKMPVPFEIKLKGGGSLFGRILIDRATKEFTYRIPREPETVVFNPFEAVLCRIEE